MLAERQEVMEKLCFDEKGALRKKQEARAAMINYLILQDTCDIDEAEDLTDRFMRGSGHWPELTMPLDWKEEA